MTRFAAPANADATEEPHVPYVLLADFDFASGAIRLNSGDRQYTHEGNPYVAFGKLASIGPLKENGELIPEGLAFTLPGVDNALTSSILTENYTGRAVRLWVAYLNDDLQFVDTPELLWEGEMQPASIQTEPRVSTISLPCESRLIRWNKASGWLYTHEHQRLIDATDDFLSFVSILVNRSLKWGGFPVRLPGRPPPRDEDHNSNERFYNMMPPGGFD